MRRGSRRPPQAPIAPPGGTAALTLPRLQPTWPRPALPELLRVQPRLPAWRSRSHGRSPALGRRAGRRAAARRPAGTSFSFPCVHSGPCALAPSSRACPSAPASASTACTPRRRDNRCRHRCRPRRSSCASTACSRSSSGIGTTDCTGYSLTVSRSTAAAVRVDT